MKIGVTATQLWTIAKVMIVTAIACAHPANADPTKRLIGLSEEDLLSCTGIPVAQMASGNKTFFQYGEFGEHGGLHPTWQYAVLGKEVQRVPSGDNA